MKILDKDEVPGWAFSVGLYKDFNHPEVVVFGLDGDVSHSVINAIGEEVRIGKHMGASVQPKLDLGATIAVS